MDILTTPVEGGGFTAYCPRANCGKTFTKASEVMAKQAVRMHIGRKHSRRIVIDQAVAQERSREAKAALGLLKPAKRTYRPRQPKITVSRHTINHCPGCGYDLKALSLAMATMGTFTTED